MKVEITVTQEEVHKAVTEWIIKQPEYEAVKAREVHVSWRGGQCDIEPGGKVKEGHDFDGPHDPTAS